VPDGFKVRVFLVPEDQGADALGTETAKYKMDTKEPADGRPPRDYKPTGRLDGSATEKQRRMIFAVARNNGIPLVEFIARVNAVDIEELGWLDISNLVKSVKVTKPITEDDCPF